MYFWYTTLMQVWPKHLTKAQIKVTISFAWYVLYSLSLLIALSFLAVSSKDAESELNAYFICESTGVNPGKVCDRSGFGSALPVYLFAAQFVVGIGYPFVNLMYALNIEHTTQFLTSHSRRSTAKL